MKKSRLGVMALILVAMLWGMGYTSCEFAYEANWSVFSILLSRSVLGFLVCWFISRKDKIFHNKEMIRDGFQLGITFFAGYALSLYGQKFTSVSNAALIVSGGIVLVPIISYFIFKRKPTRHAVIACIIGVLGSVVLAYQKGFAFQKGDIMCFLGSLFFSLHFSLLDKITVKYKTPNIIGLQFLAMAICSGIGLIIAGDKLTGNLNNLFTNTTNLYGLLGVLYYSLFSGIICFLLQGWAQKYVEPAKASLIVSTEGLFGAITGILFFAGELKLQTIIGGLIMIAALIVCNLDEIKYTIQEAKVRKAVGGMYGKD